MINKGKGCIVAVFKGLNPINIIKFGLNTVFQKPSEPSESNFILADGNIFYTSNGNIFNVKEEL